MKYQKKKINSGLITKALYINPGLEADEMDDLESETIYLIQKLMKREKKLKPREKIGEKINPSEL